MRALRFPFRQWLSALFGSAVVALASVALAYSDPIMVEVFTTADREPSDMSSLAAALGIEIRVYRLDAIRQLEADLSRNLPADARAAEREVLRRVQLLDATRKNDIQASAKTLMRARELGIDRYPAVVFEGKVVAYGSTDLRSVLAAYREYVERTP